MTPGMNSRVSLEEIEMIQTSKKSKIVITQLPLKIFLSNMQRMIIITCRIFIANFKFLHEIFTQLLQYYFATDGRHLCLKATT